MSRIFISAPAGANTGITINDPASFGNVRAFLAANPTLAVSVPTTATDRNLTAMGILNGRSIWRLRNGRDQVSVDEATLTSYGGAFSVTYDLPGTSDLFGYDTFISSSVLGTHIMSFTGFSNTKAVSTRNLSTSSIAPLPSIFGSTVAPFPASSPFAGYTLRGTIFNDTLRTTTGNTNDELNGFAGDDILASGGGNDTLIGELGNDTIDGGDGNDRLFGGDGSDSLTGGTGSDIFDYNDTFDLATDTITDFDPNLVGGDKLDLREIATLYGGVDFVENGGVTEVVTLGTGDVLIRLPGVDPNQLLQGGFGDSDFNVYVF